MPQYKLTYFSAKALGECLRMLFAYGGQDYEDVTIPYDQWPAIKYNFIFNQLPILEIDGKVYGQSSSIARYLGHKFGVAGNTLEEDLEIDQIVDFITDMRGKAMQLFYDKDIEAKTRRQEDYSKNLYPGILAKINDTIDKNNGYLALGRLTWADFVLTGNLAYLKVILNIPDLEQKYPNFSRVVQNVKNIPQVQEYIKNAPKRDFDF